MNKFPYFNPKSKRLEKLSRSEQGDLVFDLINAFALVKDPLNSALFLQDLLTASEIKNLSKRLRIAKLIIEGKKQEEIIAQLHCSFGTIAKVKAWLEEAGEGLKKIIKKLPKRKKKFKLKRGYHGYGLPQIVLASYLNYLEISERKRIENFLRNIERKDRLYKAIQKVIDREFKHF